MFERANWYSVLPQRSRRAEVGYCRERRWYGQADQIEICGFRRRLTKVIVGAAGGKSSQLHDANRSLTRPRSFTRCGGFPLGPPRRCRKLWQLVQLAPKLDHGRLKRTTHQTVTNLFSHGWRKTRPISALAKPRRPNGKRKHPQKKLGLKQVCIPVFQIRGSRNDGVGIWNSRRQKSMVGMFGVDRDRLATELLFRPESIQAS